LLVAFSDGSVRRYSFTAPPQIASLSTSVATAAAPRSSSSQQLSPSRSLQRQFDAAADSLTS
jgi:hypothetical protein